MYNTRSHTVSRALIVHELYVSLSCFLNKVGMEITKCVPLQGLV